MPNLLRFFKRCFFIAFLALVFCFILTPRASAQTTTSYPTNQNAFMDINADPSVPRNQHTLAQSVLIEVIAAVTCVAIGIDPIDPTTPCLGINPVTHQLAYPPTSPHLGDTVKVGGVLGATINMVATMYTPTTSSSEYFKSVAADFGIVKTVEAAQKNGFEGLRPVLGLWTVSRNVAYFLLIIAFLFIGIGVMLRIKIDPRTVMTIQNQIPRVIIAIILITFSYAIAAVMIDGMWAITYAGINLISSAGNTTVPCHGGTAPISTAATQGILQTPIAYMNAIFSTTCVGDGKADGILSVTYAIATSIGAVVQDAVNSFLAASTTGDCIGWTGADINACVSQALAVFMEWLIAILMLLVVFVAIIIALFRVWWSLLKAYAQLLVYVFIAPIYIVFGLAPGRPLGFERWIRGFFANLIAFPLTAYLFVAAKVASELYKSNPQDQFVPPLVGNPTSANFGVLIAFGFILLAPTVVDLMKEKLKAPATKQAGQLAAGFMGAAAAAAAPAKKTWQHWNKRNPQTGQPMGWLANVREGLGKKALSAIPIQGGKWAAQKDFMSKYARRGSKEELAAEGYDTRSMWGRGGKKRQARNNAQDQQTVQQYATAVKNGATDKELEKIRGEIKNPVTAAKLKQEYDSWQEKTRREAQERDWSGSSGSQTNQPATPHEAPAGTGPQDQDGAESTTGAAATGQNASQTAEHVTVTAQNVDVTGQQSTTPQSTGIDKHLGDITLTANSVSIQGGQGGGDSRTFTPDFSGEHATTPAQTYLTNSVFRTQADMPPGTAPLSFEGQNWATRPMAQVGGDADDKRRFMEFVGKHHEWIRDDAFQPHPTTPSGGTDTGTES